MYISNVIVTLNDNLKLVNLYICIMFLIQIKWSLYLYSIKQQIVILRQDFFNSLGFSN